MLVTLSELKAYLKITTDEEDERLELIRSAAEDAVKRYCGRSIEYAQYTEVVECSRGMCWLRETPVESVLSVTTLEGEELTVLFVNKAIGVVELAQNYSGYASVEYTGGYITIPSDIKMAVLRLSEHLYSKPAGVTSESIGELKAGYESFPQDVLRLLDVCRRVRV